MTVNRVKSAGKRVLNDDEEEFKACTPPGAKVTESIDSDGDTLVSDSNDSDSGTEEKDEIDQTLIMVIIASSVGFSALVVTLISLLICYKRKSCCFMKKETPAKRDTELQHGNFQYRE